MSAQCALVYQTLVSGQRRLIRRCPTYLRLMDRASRVWFYHVSERRGTHMRHRRVRSMVVATATVFVGVVLAAQSADRFALKAPNNIAFSEFRGYDSWTVLAVSHPDNAGGCGTSQTGCIKAIVANPVMVKAYADGFPANGKPVPDGAMMAKIEWLNARNPAAPYPVTL